MSEEEIIASLRRTYEAISRGDFDAAVEIADPDIEFVTAGLTTLRGADELRAWLEPVTLEDVRVEPEHFEFVGKNVLVDHRSQGRGVASGIILEMRFWGVWTINGAGLATRFVAFSEDEEIKARQAAGLSE